MWVLSQDIPLCMHRLSKQEKQAVAKLVRLPIVSAITFSSFTRHDWFFRLCRKGDRIYHGNSQRTFMIHAFELGVCCTKKLLPIQVIGCAIIFIADFMSQFAACNS